MKTNAKKIVISVLISLMVICLMCVKINATTSYNVELSSNKESVMPGEQFEVTIKLANITDIAAGIAGMSARLTYDTTKLEKVGDVQGLNGFMIVEGDTIEIAKYPGVTANTDVAKITFKAKTNCSGSASISLTNLEAVDGTNKYPLGRNVEKNIIIGLEISSDVYNIGEDKFITEIRPNTSVTNLLRNITCNYSMRIYNQNNQEITGTANVGSGMKLVASDQEFTLTVKGDTTGDGEIDLNDAIKILAHRAGGTNPKLTGAYLKAAQLTTSNTVELNDAIKIMKYKATNGTQGF